MSRRGYYYEVNGKMVTPEYYDIVQLCAIRTISKMPCRDCVYFDETKHICTAYKKFRKENENGFINDVVWLLINEYGFKC